MPEHFDDMDVEYAGSVSSRTMGLMMQLSVPATPRNYSVWFHYSLGIFPNLRKIIDNLLGNGRKLDAALNRELYTMFVSEQSERSLAQETTQELDGIIDGAKRFLASAIAQNKSQIAALGQVSARTTAKSDPRPIIKILVAELEKANARASQLEDNFLETSIRLEKVQFSLAEAEKKSKMDALTGLANRRSLDDFLRSSIIRSMETGEPLCAFMVDVDHFKAFNDTHGHQVGDQVLRLISKVLLDSVRDGDLAARYGGEELTAVLPGTDLVHCKEVAERVRRHIADAKLTKRTTGQEIGRVTVSIGVAQLRLGETADALIERCDRGLYKAKNAGRNRVATIEIDDQVAA